jgi:VanZ family protein
MTFRLWMAWLWTLVILFLCWLPRQYIPGEEGLRPPFVLNIDKYVHIGIFVVFGFLWMRPSESKRQYLWVFLGGVALAVITEFGQKNRFVNRDGNLPDGLADTTGVLLGLAAFWLLAKVRTTRKLEKPT